MTINDFGLALTCAYKASLKPEPVTGYTQRKNTHPQFDLNTPQAQGAHHHEGDTPSPSQFDAFFFHLHRERLHVVLTDPFEGPVEPYFVTKGQPCQEYGCLEASAGLLTKYKWQCHSVMLRTK